MAEKKLTKKDKYGMLLGVLNGEVLSEENKTILEEFIGNEVALLERKASKVDSKKNEEHESLMGAIKVVLHNTEKMTCTEIMKAINASEGTEYSLPKISAMLTKMGDKGTNEVVKTMEKKVAYFSLAD